MNNIKNELFEIKQILIPFLQKPVEGIKNLPDWGWRKLIIAQLLITISTGILGGFFHLSVASVLIGAIVVPLLTFLTLCITSLFFFYVFQIFTDKLIEFRRIFTVVFFANIPFFIFQTLSFIFPPISLIGLAIASLLLIVGFSESFQISKKFLIKLIAAIYILIATITIISYLQSHISMGKRNTRDGLDKVPEVKLGE